MSRMLSHSPEFVASHDSFNVTTYNRPQDLVVARAEGAFLYDLSGRQYIDFLAGIAVTGLGHSNPAIAEIIYDQAKTVMHQSNLFHSVWANKLAKSLVETTKQAGGMKDAARVFMANSGAEANEAALKFARKYGKLQSPDKFELISFKNSFHGRTMGALSLTPNPKYQAPFSPMVPGCKVAEINHLPSLDLITEKTCGVIVEPIQGEGGINELSADFLLALRQKCDQVGALLIYDEIQCGLGRTGKLWAHQHFPREAHPDILTMAKALGNGFPIGATMITERVEKALQVGDHGTTYGGNPMAARVGHYVLSEVSSAAILDGVAAKSQKFTERFQKFVAEYPKLVSGYRGRGLLLGLQLTSDPSPIVNAAREKGLLVITCGTNTLRFIPALNIDDKIIDDGLNILESVIAEHYKTL
ncbi:acetylornithine aminotransferase [Nadsonia fulvescens var. elongata DSM 6958]|uniref:Acetylornithine aminotransferase, mitochondrial n=1 Tax=Nadsonia fulvescens var. elongata DSM 6958 TaxID=857566 RepID=A0A1E3PMU9_9ASCO|nr:acetylornithine aminotransferase [Nadsonia fulvescens var. elongata DSM 6958]